jgi:hypothetical protein
MTALVSAQGLPDIVSVADFDYSLQMAYVGNSFSYFNGGVQNSVGELVGLSSAGATDTEAAILPTTTGKPLTYGGVSQAGSGMKFSQHVAMFANNTAIFGSGTPWDWVVFQDQSIVPVSLGNFGRSHFGFGAVFHFRST